jgi:hypothetical protein
MNRARVFRFLRIGFLIIGTLVVMIVSGAVAAGGTAYVLLSLGLKYHDNYEYYGQSPAVILIPMFGIIASAISGIIVWRLHNNHWRVSLRTLLIAMTVVAVVMGGIMAMSR